MIGKVEVSDVQDMVQAIAAAPHWLSKVQVYVFTYTYTIPAHVNKIFVPSNKYTFQAGCAARKHFKTLEEQRTNYFKSITVEEMDEIPTFLLIHLP